MKEKFEEEPIFICPLLSIGKDTPVICRHNCRWYYEKEKSCAVCEIVDELYGIKHSIPSNE